MKRQMGRMDRVLNPVGLGCMGLSGVYNEPVDRHAAVKLLQESIELGVDHYDTAEMYGFTQNEELLGEAFKGRRDEVFIATKWGPTFDREARRPLGLDGSPEACFRAIEGSLRRLGTDYVDLYYLHRVDTKLPIEESVGAMAKLVEQGKARGIGLSEAAAATIRRAAKVHPITAVQSEYSIFTRDVEGGVLEAVGEVGASLVAYSPLGRGMLTGAMTAANRPDAPYDFRPLASPRFSEEHYPKNIGLVEEIKRIGSEVGGTPAQVALAWVLNRSPLIHVIPGTTKLENLKANFGALEFSLAPEQIARLDALADRVSGQRYYERGMATVNR